MSSAEAGARNNGRNLVACDQCHKLKLRCQFLTHECGRCKRLGISCTSQRTKNKRGRKPKAQIPQQSEINYGLNGTIHYPIIDSLARFGVFSLSSQNPKIDQICTPSEACDLLIHFFTSPNQEWQTRLIRRRSLLDLQTPRVTSPTLLLSMLCLSCYMPKTQHSSLLPETGNGKLITIRRALLSQTLKSLEPVMIGESEPVFDDAVTTFMLISIGASEDDTHRKLPHWLNFLNYCVKKLNLCVEPEGFGEEEKEERRRLWWACYVIDRHVSLSFNLRPQMSDLECHVLRRPCPDIVWESTIALKDYYEVEEAETPTGISYGVLSLDLFGLFLPLSSITGDILEYHFLRQHGTFGSHRPFMVDIRNNIEQNLQVWHRTLENHLAHQISTHIQINASDSPTQVQSPPEMSHNSKVILYGRHVWHCLHILLFGTMDFVEMYKNLTWQASSDFVQAGEHAISCAQLAGSILTADPRLTFMYRYFGTYLLQSSFIFLILARKLGKAADGLILENCSVNLKVLDMFVKIVDINYQRKFAGVLRRILRERFESKDDTGLAGWVGDVGGGEEIDDLDPELLQYRWIAGYSGLWSEDMGAVRDANRRRFSK